MQGGVLGNSVYGGGGGQGEEGGGSSQGAGFCIYEEATVQRVLEFLNFLRDFIPLYANIVGPLEKWRSARVISDGEWEKSGAREAFERETNDKASSGEACAQLLIQKLY